MVPISDGMKEELFLLCVRFTVTKYIYIIVKFCLLVRNDVVIGKYKRKHFDFLYKMALQSKYEKGKIFLYNYGCTLINRLSKM